MIVVAFFRPLFENIIFISTITSWVIAQLMKMLIYILTHKHKKIREAIETVIWRTGGMPSSHSAVVCSLTTSVGFNAGVSSNLFVFSVIFTLVVLRDALGVRRAAGLLAKALNNLGKQAAEKTGLEFHAVKEIQGHSPLEVLVGAFLGIFIAAGFKFL
ncbi:MAG: divergent PAP2 family protein [Treponema sp.]|jgi:acid phosphatase family membrane protein YuiD|nr:divergent PAP2 family protein [Treponema sp.]